MRRARASVSGVASLAALAASLALPAAVRADGVKLGVRVGYYSKVDDAFLGAELLVPVAHRFYFNPNVEYVFVSDGTYMTFNADFHYDFVVDRKTFVWLGAGLGIVHDDPEGPDNGHTDAAANFLGGIGFRAGSLIPYFQAKLIAKSGTVFAVAFGIRF